MARQKIRKTRQQRQNKRTTTKEKLIFLKKALLRALVDYIDVLSYRGRSAFATGLVTLAGVKGFVLLLAPNLGDPQLVDFIVKNAVAIAIVLDFSLNSLDFIIRKIIKYYKENGQVKR